MAQSHRDEFRKLMFAYAAFQMAAIFILYSQPTRSIATLIITTLFAISIPSTIAYGGLARITEEDEARNPHPLSAICALLAYVPSLAALSIMLGFVSRLAALVFPATCIIWVVVIVRLRKNQAHTITESKNTNENINKTTHNMRGRT
jgi:hypothetical protein